MSTILYDPDAELERLYAAITGRPAFSYDPTSDPVYDSYARSCTAWRGSATTRRATR